MRRNFGRVCLANWSACAVREVINKLGWVDWLPGSESSTRATLCGNPGCRAPATARLDSGCAPVGNGLGLLQPPPVSTRHARSRLQVLRYAYLSVRLAETAFPAHQAAP